MPVDPGSIGGAFDNESNCIGENECVFESSPADRARCFGMLIGDADMDGILLASGAAIRSRELSQLTESF